MKSASFENLKLTHIDNVLLPAPDAAWDLKIYIVTIRICQ